MTEEEKAVNEAQQQTACQIMSCDNVIRCKENILYGTSVCVCGVTGTVITKQLNMNSHLLTFCWWQFINAMKKNKCDYEK